MSKQEGIDDFKDTVTSKDNNSGANMKSQTVVTCKKPAQGKATEGPTG